MSRRWLVLFGLVGLLILAGCELATPLPVETTPIPTVRPTATAAVRPTATPIPWPAQRMVFTHLGKIWMVDGAGPYALTVGVSPVLSPDGQRVAYLLMASETEGLSQVYVLHLPAGEIFLASGEPASYGTPVWSPDGRTVAYTNGALLILADPRGEVQRVLATDVATADAAAAIPVWTADGRTILCPLSRLGMPELFAIRVDNGEAVRLSYTEGYRSTAPFVVLSRDSTVGEKDTVIYTNEADGGTLWATDLAGSARRRILPELDQVTQMMRLSGDGGQLAGLRQAAGARDFALWVVDLTTGRLSQGGDLPALPEAFHWDVERGMFYWVWQSELYGYSLASGQDRQIAALPPPSPTPTATPLPVERLLIYYLENEFYRAKAYEQPERFKSVPVSQAVLSGYVLRGGTVAFHREANLYLLELRGGVTKRLYSFQQEDLVLIELTWSLQGDALFYAAVYNQEEGTALGRRVDLGVIRLRPKTHEFVSMQRFTSLTDRSGALPLFYDEESGQAIVAPLSGEGGFDRLDVYDVVSGVEAAFLDVRGAGPAAVSDDLRWAAVAGYDEGDGRGYIRLYDLTTAETISRTFLLPEGTFTRGPLRWSPEGDYLAFIPLAGEPSAAAGAAQGIWVLRPDTLEATPVIAVDDPLVYLVGWSSEP